MSVFRSEFKLGLSTFGLPDQHFLRLTVEVLNQLGPESHHRGHPMLASLLDIAKTEAEDTLRTGAPAGGQRVPEEAKLLRVVNEIRNEITTMTGGITPLPCRGGDVEVLGELVDRAGPAMRRTWVLPIEGDNSNERHIAVAGVEFTNGPSPWVNLGRAK